MPALCYVLGCQPVAEEFTRILATSNIETIRFQKEADLKKLTLSCNANRFLRVAVIFLSDFPGHDEEIINRFFNGLDGREIPTVFILNGKGTERHDLIADHASAEFLRI